MHSRKEAPMRRVALKLTSLAVILFGTTIILSSQPGEAEPLKGVADCCYSDCVDTCTEENSWSYCHHTCNEDCQAC